MIKVPYRKNLKEPTSDALQPNSDARAPNSHQGDTSPISFPRGPDGVGEKVVFLCPHCCKNPPQKGVFAKVMCITVRQAWLQQQLANHLKGTTETWQRDDTDLDRMPVSTTRRRSEPLKKTTMAIPFLSKEPSSQKHPSSLSY